MTAREICSIIIVLYTVIVLYSMGLAIAAHMFEKFKNTFSENKRICYSLCWPLAIIILPIYYLIKKYKLNLKLKEANKLEDYQHKKEIIYTVLKELKLR